MIYIVTALQTEAEAIIGDFCLKKGNDELFPVYENSQARLLVCGMGKVKASIGTTYLLTRYGASACDRIFNIGICASAKQKHSVGDIFMIRSIIDAGSGKKYMTGDLESNQFERLSISCVDTAAVRQKSDSVAGDLVDMESAGFYQAARAFLDISQISLIKVVSDLMEPDRLNAERIASLIKNSITKIHQTKVFES